MLKLGIKGWSLTQKKPMWRYIIDGIEQGPVSQQELYQMIMRGQISRKTRICKNNSTQWICAEDIDGIGQEDLSNIPRQSLPLFLVGIVSELIGLLLTVWQPLGGFILMALGLCLASMGLSLRKNTQIYSLFR